MNKIIKVITIMGIIAISLIFIVIVSRNDRYLKVPNSEELSSIILVDVIGEKGVQKITVYQQVDINRFLEIFKNSNRTDKQSISEFPSSTNFTAVLFKFKSGGNNFRSVYEGKGDLYIDQPFVGVFKLDSNDLYMLDEIIKRGNKEDISIKVEDILKGNF